MLRSRAPEAVQPAPKFTRQHSSEIVIKLHSRVICSLSPDTLANIYFSVKMAAIGRLQLCNQMLSFFRTSRMGFVTRLSSESTTPAEVSFLLRDRMRFSVCFLFLSSPHSNPPCLWGPGCLCRLLPRSGSRRGSRTS